MGTCDKHRKQPAWGYSTCAGCEVEHQRDNIKALTAERDRYREALERIAELPNLSGMQRVAFDYEAIAKDALKGGEEAI